MLKRTVFGLPLTPASLLDQLSGESFCVSYGTRRNLANQLYQAERLVGDDQILIVDNGAFTTWRQGKQFDFDGFVNWQAGILSRCPQAVAVVPDVIDGSVEQNSELMDDWLGMPGTVADRSMVIWHMGEPLHHLEYLLASWNYIGIGSSGEYHKPGTPNWHARMDDAMAVVSDYVATGEHRPWLHLMRAQSHAHRYPVDSSDSCSVAVNHCRYRDQGHGHVRRYADRVRSKIDASCDGIERTNIETPATLADMVQATRQLLACTTTSELAQWRADNDC